MTDTRAHLSTAQLRAVVSQTESLRPVLPARTRMLPSGVVSELAGPDNSGKTTAALRLLGHAQRHGQLVALIDSDGTFDREYAAKLGLDCSGLAVSQPDTGEDACSLLLTLVRAAAFSVVAVDSVASLVPQPQAEVDLDSLQARLVARTFTRVVAVAAANDVAVLVTHPLGADDSPHPSGRVLRYYAPVRLDARNVLTNGWTLREG